MYSIKPILKDYSGKDGQRQILIRVIYNRRKVYLKTELKAAELKNGLVINHRQAAKFNSILTKRCTEAEDVLLEAIRAGNVNLKELFKRTDRNPLLTDYIDTLIKRFEGKLSAGRLRHYSVVKGKIKAVNPGIRVRDVDISFIRDFEDSMKALDNTTIRSKLSVLKAILNRADEDGLFDSRKIAHHKMPKQEYKIPEHLTENEISDFWRFTDFLPDGTKKTSGYYFLLSCFAGYRISDALRFNPDMIQGEYIRLRALKNKTIVSMPVYPNLKKVTDYIKERRLSITPERLRLFVYEIARDAGIRKKITFHTSRHSFAMLLMAKGFTIEDVAYYLGDTPTVAKVYARMYQPSLDSKVRDRL